MQHNHNRKEHGWRFKHRSVDDWSWTLKHCNCNPTDDFQKNTVWKNVFSFLQVREAATNTLVDVYRHVGDRVRADLGKRGLPAQRWAFCSFLTGLWLNWCSYFVFVQRLCVPWPWHWVCPSPHHAPPGLSHTHTRGTFFQSTMLTDWGWRAGAGIQGHKGIAWGGMFQ